MEVMENVVGRNFAFLFVCRCTPSVSVSNLPRLALSSPTYRSPPRSYIFYFIFFSVVPISCRFLLPGTFEVFPSFFPPLFFYFSIFKFWSIFSFVPFSVVSTIHRFDFELDFFGFNPSFYTTINAI